MMTSFLKFQNAVYISLRSTLKKLQLLRTYWILGYCSYKYEEFCLMGCNAVWRYATSRKVARSNLDKVFLFYNLPNPSSRTTALGFTHPLTD
jgi:hypothetical protein